MGIQHVKISTFATATAAACAFALTGFAASAHAADSNVTITGELGVVGAHSSKGPDTNLGGLQLRAGAQFATNFGAEVEGSIGVGNDEVNVGAGPTFVKVGQKYEVGAFAVGYLPMGPHADLIARVGYAQTELEAKSAGVTSSQTSNGAAAGVGARLFPESGADGVRVDYTHYFFNNDAAADAVSLTWQHKF